MKTDVAIEDRYELVTDAHGEGGFGKVSIHRDRILERNVAAKRLLLLNDMESRERFTREAKTLARMSHPNIPAIYDVRFSDSEMIIFFEFIEGKTLRQLVEEGSIPSIEDARRWFTQIASALDHAHSLKLVHRDIKPENIIISPDKTTATLVDFGICLSAEDVKRITETGHVIGTWDYMSPEQREGKELDGTSDLYSLGITLYEILCGSRPDAAHYSSLSDVNESIPPAIDDIVKECLTRDPKHRMASARDFTLRLRSAFRTGAPLSTLLTDARLHELHAALDGMTPTEFHDKPLGQRLLIINRVRDLVRVASKPLLPPTAEMIALLVFIAQNEDVRSYGFVTTSAFEWGFDKYYGEKWQGNQSIREALIAAAKQSPGHAHQILAEQFLALIAKSTLDDKPAWYYHDLRILATCLLANPVCGSTAEALAEAYDRINEISH